MAGWFARRRASGGAPAILGWVPADYPYPAIRSQHLRAARAQAVYQDYGGVLPQPGALTWQPYNQGVRPAQPPVRAVYQNYGGVLLGSFGGLATIPAPTAFWRMDEATGGTRFDTAGSVNLADQGSTPRATGLVGFAAGPFSNANYLRNTTTGLGTSGTWELGCWINLTSIAALETVWNASGAFLRIGSSSADGIPRFSGGSNLDWGSALSTGVWYALSCGYDGTNSFLTVNAAAPVTAANTAIPGTDFSFGDLAGAGQALSGVIDATAFWKGTVLTSAQRTAWYNGGVGTEFFSGHWS